MIFKGSHRDLGRYVREMADLCGLRDWTVRVDEVPADDDCDGQCRVVYGRKVGIVRVASGWAEMEPEALRNTICHELLHMHTEPMKWALNNAQAALGDTAFGILDAAHTDALEVAIDAIATAWAETLPLPVKAKKRKEAA